MKCKNCGNVFEEGIFCPECGTRYIEEEPVVEAIVEEVIESQEISKIEMPEPVQTEKNSDEKIKPIEEEEPVPEKDITSTVVEDATVKEVAHNVIANNTPSVEASEKNTKNTNVLGIVSVIISVIGIVTTFIVVGIVLDVIGLVVSILALKKKDKPKKAATVGLVLSIIGIVIFIVLVKVLGF